jgi:hypothetical protein
VSSWEQQLGATWACSFCCSSKLGGEGIPTSRELRLVQPLYDTVSVTAQHLDQHKLSPAKLCSTPTCKRLLYMPWML